MNDFFIVNPAPTDQAFANPLKGFRLGTRMVPLHPYATLSKTYIKWCDIENHASDGVCRILEHCDKLWQPGRNTTLKIIPRVYLDWPRGGKYWPADLQAGDYTSIAFKDRLVGLIAKLGRAWDNDPTVAFVEMGIIGQWGEHHHPSPSAEIQQLMGQAYSSAFSNKLLMHRHPWEFTDWRFGIYWDSFAHPQQENHRRGIEVLGDRWKTAPIGGETAFDWGEPLGRNPTDAVANHFHALSDAIRSLHANHLGWITLYDQENPQAAQNAALIQKAMGYRFEILEVRYPKQVSPGDEFAVELKIRNSGSSPLYYNWPIELCLAEPASRQGIWRGILKDDVDVRKWIGGDRWDSRSCRYLTPPPVCQAGGSFILPTNLPAGRYVLTLAILDPAYMTPSVRFATPQHWSDGRHPIGMVGVGMEIASPQVDQIKFD